MNRRLSTRARLVAYGLAVIAGAWTAAGCAVIAAWCVVCHRAERRELTP